MALCLEYRGSTTAPIEVEGISPETVAGKSLAEIERLPIYEGNRDVRLGDFFAVSGDPNDETIRWEGDLRGVHWIGAKMTRGTMHVAGNAGRHVGSEMRGGTILVEGDVGDWAGAEIHGGLIDVRGNAGHLAGAAYRGSARGMTRGTILIAGNAGNEVGRTMRRGLIAIGGSVGDLAGFNMLAGTILIFGDSGVRCGAGMRRGTIGLFGSQRPRLLPSFRRACQMRPLAVDLLLRYLVSLGFAVPEPARDGSFDVYNGDLIEGGRGEVLVRAA